MSLLIQPDHFLYYIQSSLFNSGKYLLLVIIQLIVIIINGFVFPSLKIICNDCQAHCIVPFHVLGMKCSSCGSYNTAQEGGLIQRPEPLEQDTEAETDTESEPQDQPASPTQHQYND